MAHIAVIEDSLDQIKLYETVLRRCGHKVSHAKDGKSGLRLVRKEMPDLVILDISLPFIDGFEVCRQLKEDKKTKAIPVVMASAAYPNPADAKKGLKVGAAKYMNKPIPPPDLVETVELLLDLEKDSA
jgi:CheY-like chemotaxis protein